MNIFDNAETVQIDGNSSILKTEFQGFTIWKITHQFKHGVKPIEKFEICNASELSLNATYVYENYEDGFMWYSYNNLNDLLADITNYVNAQKDIESGKKFNQLDMFE